MKKSFIIIFSLLVTFQTQAQDYLISFAGTGGSTTVDSVQVRNLTQNTSLTLNGADVIHLMGVVGIDQAIEQTSSDLRIYPNPMNEQSFVEFETASSGDATIEVCGITGKQVVQTHRMLSCGRHIFTVSGLSGGIYNLSIHSAGYVYSGKIVCINKGPCCAKISYISTHPKFVEHGKLKSIQSLVPMQYTSGDQLLFKCFSDIYATVIPLVPTQSQTVTANFIACTDADNNNYATVTIGTQIWMAENLNVGVRVNSSQVQSDNGIIEKYCYNDSAENCNKYGGLYQWDEMMQWITAPGVKGICPTGWHIPIDWEWCTVTQFLDPSVNCGSYGWSGTNAGGKMKSTGTIDAGTGLWYSPNTGATNESGFTALPAGYLGTDGTFSYVVSFGYWWSSSEYDTDGAWDRIVGYIYSSVYRSPIYKHVGFSVRCVRDESAPFTCGSSITVNHVAGAVAPVDKTVTYGTVNNIPGETSKCWITSNLGADHQATAVDDTTEASAGWYWQFNRKQGYKHTGTVRTPNTVWISSISENFNWTPANDPCTLELGVGWCIPTYTEWTNVDASANWTNWNGPWNSGLKMHAAGGLGYYDGSLANRGAHGYYWSSTQSRFNLGLSLYFFSSGSGMNIYFKENGFSARCVRDY